MDWYARRKWRDEHYADYIPVPHIENRDTVRVILKRKPPFLALFLYLYLPNHKPTYVHIYVYRS